MKNFHVLMVSPKPGEHCDKFPCGSIHAVVKDERGLRLAGKVDYIPSKFPTSRVKEDSIEVKYCPGGCKNTFLADHPFVESRQKGDEPMCVRCYARKYLVGPEEYNKAFAGEIMLFLHANTML